MPDSENFVLYEPVENFAMIYRVLVGTDTDLTRHMWSVTRKRTVLVGLAEWSLVFGSRGQISVGTNSQDPMRDVDVASRYQQMRGLRLLSGFAPQCRGMR
jgi:hypothetical protein